jgi:hypothetical protein
MKAREKRNKPSLQAFQTISHHTQKQNWPGEE